MVVDPSSTRRFEWKYCVPLDVVGELCAALDRCTRADAYCNGPDGLYHVRSLYYDTPDLRFYHEKKDRLRIRRKLRIRDYGADEYFLEIKRKLDNKVAKERVPVPASRVSDALDGMAPEVLLAGRPEVDRRTLERFRSNLRTLGLIPTLLVAYDRRAMVGQDEPDVRITLDRELRGRMYPGAEALFEEHHMVGFETRQVLELKFSGRPPRWVVEIVARFRLQRVSYSKYCEGIDRCTITLDEPGADRSGGARSA